MRHVNEDRCIKDEGKIFCNRKQYNKNKTKQLRIYMKRRFMVEIQSIVTRFVTSLNTLLVKHFHVCHSFLCLALNYFYIQEQPVDFKNIEQNSTRYILDLNRENVIIIYYNERNKPKVKVRVKQAL